MLFSKTLAYFNIVKPIIVNYASEQTSVQHGIAHLQGFQKILFAIVNLSPLHFTQDIHIPMNPFLCQNLKTIYNVVPYGDHRTERVSFQWIWCHNCHCVDEYWL
jgi:hypothetical protein